MKMNDYIVLVDEKGQPYIAHRRGQLVTNLREGAKSVAKVVDGAKTRYLKTQEEVNAYLNQGKQKAKQAVNKAKQKAKDWSGVTAREKRDRAASDYKNATDKQRMARLKAAKSANRAGRLNEQYKEAQEQANSAIKDANIANYKYNSSVQWRDSAKKNYDEAKNRNAIEKVLDKTLAGIAGVKTIEESTYDSFRRASAQAADRKLEAESANRKAEAAKNKRSELLDKANKEHYQHVADERAKMQADKDYDAAESAYKKAIAEYGNTPLGKIEAAKEKFADAKETAKAYASDKLGDISKGFNSAKDKAKGAVDSAKEKASQAVDKAKDAASSVKSSYDRMKEEFAESKAKKEADKAIKKASADFKDFKEKYKSPDPNIFTYDKSTGQTVNTKQEFDFYAGKAEDIYSYLNSHPYITVNDKQRLLDDAQDYLDMAKNYAQQKK